MSLSSAKPAPHPLIALTRVTQVPGPRSQPKQVLPRDRVFKLATPTIVPGRLKTT